ncbi:phage tail protein [Proteiniborus sp. MB09-C3]|uniref:phage tail protein n=1 Tax=Proteiniborus sp. MB09-C3 TaxID=3050072 RepID=UPI002556D59A|nr:phage tail protein [Proteiniborus sp. MB09-C3]WIV10547.1 phage tail protein [Proteiniborus sp. MB09-C3]
MLIDINPNLELPDYKLTLCKLNEEPLQELSNITDIIYTPFFANIDELTFNIPLYRTTSDGDKIKNEIFDLVSGDHLILLNDGQFFYIDYVEKIDDGEIYKAVHCYSREYELSDKKIINYSAESRKLYSLLNEKDENGLEIGIMNYIEKICSWRVGYVNPNLLNKYRSFIFENFNLLQVLQETQKSFECLFKFDTINKIINIYEVSELGNNQGLYISDKNFIETLKEKTKSDEIKTRLYLFGENNISIEDINITGMPYIEDISFYKNTNYMSQELIDALNNYEILIESKQSEFEEYLSQIEALKAQTDNKYNELVQLNIELKAINTNIDANIGKPEYSQYLQQQFEKQVEIDAKISEINNLNNQIDGINASIKNMREEIDSANYFTEKQAKELDTFIKEETYTSLNYTIDNIEELLEQGIKILNKISRPVINFDIEVEDFLRIVEYQHLWKKLRLGDKINIHHSEMGFDVEVRLVSYSHNIEDNTLSLSFSNKNSIDDSSIYLRDLLGEVKTTSTQLIHNRIKWDEGSKANLAIKQYMNSKLDISKQQIVKASGQHPMFDERGGWFFKENPDGTIDPEQIRIANNQIVLTTDGFNTVKVAISPFGILAPYLIGDIILGSNLKILGDNGILEILGNLLTIKDNQDKTRVLMGEYEAGKYGAKYSHNDNSETIIDEDGFKRKITSNGNTYNYINLNYAGNALTTGSYNQDGDEANPIIRKTQQELDDLGVGVDWIEIPNPDFKNRQFIVIPSLLSLGEFWTAETGGSYSTVWSHYLVTDLGILDYDYINGKFQIRARRGEYAMYRGKYMYERWTPVTVSYYVYAIT